MNVAASALKDLCARTENDEGGLFRTVINSTSTTEAGFAVGLLSDTAPPRTLVGALNLREILRELPESPFVMRTDFDSLARIAGLDRRGHSWVKRVGDGEDSSEIELLGQGNLCYDVVLHAGDRTTFLKPGPVNGDVVKPGALDLLLQREDLLRSVVDLVGDMGLVHNPRFYITVDDWQLEHAAESMSGLSELF